MLHLFKSWPLKSWPLVIIFLYITLLYGDVIFGAGSLNSLANSPAAQPYQIAKYEGWLENTPLNSFPPGDTNHRAFWDRPQVYDPNIQAAHEAVRRGEFPWLNPSLALGVPLFANGVDSSFFLGNAVMMLISPRNWDYVYLLLYYLSALSVYLVLHLGYRLKPASSLLGSILYISAGIFPPQLGYGGEIFNVHCFTYALLFIELLRRAKSFRQAWLWGALISFTMAQAFYAGMPEGSVACCCMASLYALIRLWRPADGSFLAARAAAANWSPWPGIFTVGIIGIGALAFAAPYVVSLYYYSTLMAVSHEVGGLTLPLQLLPNLFIPFVRGWLNNNFFPELPTHHIQVVFVGLAPLVMLLYMCTNFRRNELPKRLIPFAIIIVLYLSQSYGTSPFNLCITGHIPVLKHIFIFRFFSPIFVLSVSLICASLFDSFLTQSKPILGIRFLLGTICLAVLYLCYLQSLHMFLPGGTEVYERFLRNNRIYTAFFFVLPLLSACVAFRHRLSLQSAKILRPIFLILFIFAAQYHFAKGFFRKQDPFQPTPSIEFLHSRQSSKPFRIYSTNLLFPGAAAGYGLEDIRHMNPIVPASALQVLSSFFGEYAKDRVRWERFEGLNDDNSAAFYNHPAFDLLNVSYFVRSAAEPPPPPAAKVTELYRDSQAVILANEGVRQRYTLYSKWQVVPDNQQLLLQVAEDPGRLRRKVLLQEPPQFDARGLPSASIGTAPIRLLARWNSGYDFEVSLPDNRLLVISDAFYRGYRAWLNDQRVPVYSVNGGLIGIALPAGSYRVSLRFRPPFARTTIAVGALALIAALLPLVIGWGNLRQQIVRPLRI